MDALERMLLFCDESHGDYDIAAANLMAAAGLRWAEDLDVGAVLAWLDRAANEIRLATERHAYQFREGSEQFENSPAYFSMLVMATVLCRQFGVRYNPAKIRDPKFQDPNCFTPDFSDSRDLFIHGLITGPGGTCASMPVLYASVGRRLGYPLKLVQSKGHMFVRWDDPNGEVFQPGARFNIEATTQGLGCPPDEHYRNWPMPITETEDAAGIYLRSLTPREEVAEFRSTRGICLWENGRYAEALREYHLAIALAPSNQGYVRTMLDAYKAYRANMATKTREEIAEFALGYDEEVQLQKNIVGGHHECLRRGQPGYNLAQYGIYPKALAAPTQQIPNHPDQVHAIRSLNAGARAIQQTSSIRSTITTDGGYRQAPAMKQALDQMERMKRLTEENRQLQERLRRGAPGSNPGGFGS
jgi:tetratricopeptide (TPR) repeat protein